MSAADDSVPQGSVVTSGSDGRPASGQGGRIGLDAAAVLVSVGICCVVFGGLVAAVTEPLELAHGSWVAAYLVLVGGVAQCAMGYARIRHTSPAQSHGWDWGQAGAWNLGNALVIAGTLASEPSIVDVGSVFLVAALAIAFHATRSVTGRAANRAAESALPWGVWVYRIVLLMLAVSIPVGMMLSHLRHS